MKNRRIKYLLLSTVLDFFFLCSSFLFFTWIFPGTRNILIPKLLVPFLIFSALWLIISLISGKYNDPHLKTLSQIIGSLFISGLTMFVITLVFVLVETVNKKEFVIAIGTGFFTFVLECMWTVWVVSRIKFIRETGNPGWLRPMLYPEMMEEYEGEAGWVQLSENSLLPEGVNPGDPFAGSCDPGDSISKALREKYLAGNPALFDFLVSHLPLDSIHRNHTQLVNTHTLFNLQNVEENSQQLIVNFHRMNDIRRINEFLIQVNRNLMPGGWFVCCAFTKEQRKELYLQRFPFPFNWIFYTVDFVIHRALPKIPISREIYFTLTRGKSRVISHAEILGRLYFCGFEKIGRATLQGNYYILVQKLRQPRQDPNPSYGPLIKMQRVGKEGRTIPIYKFRTMHPYSEYIQGYVYKTRDLDDSGKFRDDFRITTWGRIFRKTWIDELPQLLNLYRGQLKLVGVRAISRHYFSLYPKELQDLRTKTKPGIIPPYYVDLPHSFEEICESERRYLESYFKHPWRTDWRYFWKAVFNILFKHARSS